MTALQAVSESFEYRTPDALPTATSFVRKMRGGAQSHLLRADDGGYYVVKFLNNPQHRRVLINELICGGLLDLTPIAHPHHTLINITQAFLARNPEVHFQIGSRTLAVDPGLAFASRYPGDPDRLAVFDFVPDSLLLQVVNLGHFWSAVAFDCWVGNSDGRQAVFFRANVRDLSQPDDQIHSGFVAWMIDNGFAFDGPHWAIRDTRACARYPRRLAYQTGKAYLDTAISAIMRISDDELIGLADSVPREWLAPTEPAQLERLMETLARRRDRLRPLCEQT